MAKKRGPTPPRAVRMEARGRPGQIKPTADRRKQARKRNLITAGIVLLLIGGVVTLAVVSQLGDKPLPGVTTDPPPWGAEVEHLSERVRALDLPGFNETTFHIHVHVDVFVDGQEITVPISIGNRVAPPALLAAIHTHNDLGTFHVEGDRPYDATVGDLFDIWGVWLTDDCLGDRCGELTVYVNGEKLEAGLDDYKVKDLDQIAVVYGRSPAEVPGSFDFGSDSSVTTAHPTPTPGASPTGEPTTEPSASASPSG